jgi:hypothetical protein
MAYYTSDSSETLNDSVHFVMRRAATATWTRIICSDRSPPNADARGRFCNKYAVREFGVCVCVCVHSLAQVSAHNKQPTNQTYRYLERQVRPNSSLVEKIVANDAAIQLLVVLLIERTAGLGCVVSVLAAVGVVAADDVVVNVSCGQRFEVCGNLRSHLRLRQQNRMSSSLCKATLFRQRAAVAWAFTKCSKSRSIEAARNWFVRRRLSEEAIHAITHSAILTLMLLLLMLRL